VERQSTPNDEIPCYPLITHKPLSTVPWLDAVLIAQQLVQKREYADLLRNVPAIHLHSNPELGGEKHISCVTRVHYPDSIHVSSSLELYSSRQSPPIHLGHAIRCRPQLHRVDTVVLASLPSFNKLVPVPQPRVFAIRNTPHFARNRPHRRPAVEVVSTAKPVSR